MGKTNQLKLPKRLLDSNKGCFGRILNIAGSLNYSGAAYLSSISALKIGAGYVSLACPDIIRPVIAGIAPELTFKPLKSKNGAIAADNIIEDIEKYSVISIGCGLTNTEETRKFFFNIIEQITPAQKLVIDADGINILADARAKCPAAFKLTERNSSNTIITPHPKELSRLLNIKIEDILANKEKFALAASKQFGCITVLKGHKSLITNGLEIHSNQTKTSALAKAGTGDVLTGVISGLLAQNTESFDAAILGVFIHGLAGDFAAEDLTEYCVLASDVINYLPAAVKYVIKQNK